MAESVETAIYRLQIEGQDQLDRLTKSIDGLAVAEEDATKATRTTSDELQRRLARYDPLIRAQQAYAKELENIARYQETGVGTQQQINALFDGATARYQAAQTAVKGLGDAHVGMSGQAQAAMHSMRSLFDSIVAGASPVQALTQQLGRLSYAASGEGGIAGAFKGAGSMIGSMIETVKGFLSPANVAIGAIVGIGAAIIAAAAKFATAQKEIERSLIGIGGQSGATAAKINAFAQIGPQQSITGPSISERRDIGTSFAQGGIDVSKLTGATDAVRGYAIVAGTDATEATKALAAALGGDLVKAVDDLQKVYGALDPALKDTVQSMLLVNNAAGAQQAILDAIAGANKRALDTVTPLSAAWSGLKNAGEMVAQGWLKILSTRVFETVGQKAAAAAKEAAAAAAAALQQSNQTINKGGAVVDTYEPEIRQVKKLQQALADLVRAKQAAATAGKNFDDGGAEQKIRNTIKATEDSYAAALRYQDVVAGLAQKWGDVSAAVAMQLQTQQNNLQVVQAIGGAAKMNAQEAADYANAILQGKSATEATAIAAGNLQTAMAQVNAQAKETLLNLQNQEAAAAAVTGAEQMHAQAVATLNQLLLNGVDYINAQAVAAQQLANATASATAAVERQVKSLEDSTAMIQARKDGTEANTAAEIAYKNAIESGASATAAAALSAATLANKTAEADASMKSADASAKSFSDTIQHSGGPGVEMLGKGMQNVGQQMQNAVTSLDHFMDGIGSAKSLASDLADQLARAAAAETQALNSSSFQWANSVDANGILDVTKAGRSPFDPDVMPKGPLTIIGGAIGGSYTAFGIPRTTPELAAGYRAALFPDVSASSLVSNALSQGPGGADSAISAITTAVANSAFGAKVTDATSTLQTLYGIKNKAAPDDASRIGNDQQFLQWLQGQPQTIENLSAISSLTEEIKSLSTATDSNTSATNTNSDLLSPYYATDPRTSHIGFRSQGMATGGEIQIPGGYSANDNMMVRVPVASGELLSVRRPGQTNGTAQTFNVTNHITIAGNANKDEVLRTSYQLGQTMAKQLAAASR